MADIHDDSALQVAPKAGFGGAPLNLVPFAPKRRWFRLILRWLSSSKTESEYERILESRHLLSDEAFYQSHYVGSGIPMHVPVRMRAILSRELGEPWNRLIPGDRPVDIIADLDLYELGLEAESEFGIRISAEELNELDGSFDSLVRLVSRKLESTA